MSGNTFELFKGKDGQFYVRERAPNNKIVGTGSEGFMSLWAARNNAHAQGASDEQIIDLTEE